ncbi:two-component sensor histidine kinase [Ornithinimicrobium pekingense]|uniref:histidine kinase n=1 Tax=Ornithinimicrobium pekingense TaxID=384677 RepID=A0ABQ2F8W1_9MICO|nr:two-component sensor histidine kinase [Ornithinimicrobium pekingense]
MLVEPLSRRGWAVDVAVAGLVAAVGLLEVWVPFESLSGDGSPFVSTVGVVWFAAHLAVRRARPWVALAGLLVWPLLGVFEGGQGLHLLFFGQLVPVLVLVFTIARHGTGTYRRVGTGAAIAFIALADLFVPLLQSPNELLFHWGVLTLVWLVGHGLRVSADRAAAEAVRAHVAETTARERELAAISDERARIARELHDIVAHSVGVIVVQAGAAEQVVEDDPEFARRALATIRTTGSGALAEMRRLVGMLRDPDPGLGHDLAPQPGIAALPDLVEAARGVGLSVDLDVSGVPPTLPAGLDLTAYRVVQEALTNVRRHSRATSARVAMQFAPESLEIRVTDAGPARQPGAEPGHGLVGMRERVALFGGRVEADAGEHGFTVRAVLPLERV